MCIYVYTYRERDVYIYIYTNQIYIYIYIHRYEPERDPYVNAYVRDAGRDRGERPAREHAFLFNERPQQNASSDNI